MSQHDGWAQIIPHKPGFYWVRDDHWSEDDYGIVELRDVAGVNTFFRVGRSEPWTPYTGMWWREAKRPC